MATTQQDIRSRRRHSHGEHNPARIDRLSSLPDSILCHILSFLPTKFSIRTSALSKRWRNICAYVPNLDFELENQDIINRVLLQHKAQTIDNFHLIHKNDCFLINKNECTDYQLETWIIFAILRNVKNLHLCFFSSMMLPRRLFTCKTLVSLKLDDCGVVPDIGSAVCLPRLKKLHLTCVRYEGDGSLSNLLSGCPVLEELVMELIMDLVSCNISSPTIKRLTLDFRTEGLISDYYDYINDYWLEINAPSLTYLKMIHCFTEDIKCGMLNSLIEADVDIFNYNDFPYSRSEVEFIDRLCNVKFLNLDLRHCTGIIDSSLSGWTISFRNLTKLELTADCRFLSKFLESADNLEIFIFSEFRQEIEGWMEPQQVPTCLLSNLRFIKLVNIEGKYHEYEYVNYLLRNAQVLERMEISHIRYISCEEKLYMLQQISLFRRASSACEVAFALDDA